MYRRPGGEFWLLLRHGLASRRQEVLSAGGSDTLIFRPGEYDVLVYNSERGELRIHGCNVKEVEMLRCAFGQHFFVAQPPVQFLLGGGQVNVAGHEIQVGHDVV